MNRKPVLLLWTALILACAALLWAAAPTTLESAPPVLGRADVAAVSTSVADFRAAQSRTRITLSPAFSAAAATADIGIVRGVLVNGAFQPRSVAFASQFTAGGASGVTIDGLFPAPSQELPLAGYTHFAIVCTTLSTGTARVDWSLH